MNNTSVNSQMNFWSTSSNVAFMDSDHIFRSTTRTTMPTNIAMCLQHSIGNKAVKDLFADKLGIRCIKHPLTFHGNTLAIQRKLAPGIEEHFGHIQVSWSDDETELLHRIIDKIDKHSAFAEIPRYEYYQPIFFALKDFKENWGEQCDRLSENEIAKLSVTIDYSRNEKKAISALIAFQGKLILNKNELLVVDEASREKKRADVALRVNAYCYGLKTIGEWLEILTDAIKSERDEWHIFSDPTFTRPVVLQHYDAAEKFWLNAVSFLKENSDVDVVLTAKLQAEIHDLYRTMKELIAVSPPSVEPLEATAREITGGVKGIVESTIIGLYQFARLGLWDWWAADFSNGSQDEIKQAKEGLTNLLLDLEKKGLFEVIGERYIKPFEESEKKEKYTAAGEIAGSFLSIVVPTFLMAVRITARLAYFAARGIEKSAEAIAKTLPKMRMIHMGKGFWDTPRAKIIQSSEWETSKPSIVNAERGIVEQTAKNSQTGDTVSVRLRYTEEGETAWITHQKSSDTAFFFSEESVPKSVTENVPKILEGVSEETITTPTRVHAEGHGHLDLRPDIVMPGGGKSGSAVKFFKAPPNSVLKGQGYRRIYITDADGNVIRDITPKRAKTVIPGKGFIKSKRKQPPPSSLEIKMIDQIWGTPVESKGTISKSTLQRTINNQSVVQLFSEEFSRPRLNIAVNHIVFLQESEEITHPMRSQGQYRWMNRTSNLREAAKARRITPDIEKELLVVVNEVIGDVDLPPVEIYSEKQFDVEPGHVYFDKDFFGVEGHHAGATFSIFQFGSVTRFAEQGRKGDYLGKGIKIGPEIIQDTAHYTKSVLLHEKTHVLETEEIAKAESETRACAEQFKYLYGFSERELEGVVGYYLVNYVNADAKTRYCSDTLIRQYALQNAGSGSRPIDKVLLKLQQLRSDLQEYRELPEEKLPLANIAMDNLIEAIDEAMHKGLFPTSEYILPGTEKEKTGQ